ncbi:DUF866 domain-containing protein [Nannizzia gypsea CBS 118893]|uniref:DUF866 domain-containing protein n=1 Tax=Arthroderma gypseum (strain ATCC MYA-4604 / CBS 118893) TaxID=535722 RepID=E4UXC6_ARTGP|nr:DUF866 domain-containing protein [Nannizzia gypsea CBS 118893]EFR01874.1 DUF866 domain-containing protein [Nannizzia gypsea CBS 118893]
MFTLALSAQTSGVTDIRPQDTLEDPYYYTFMVQCTSCREIHPNWVNISRFETHEVPGGRGEANFVWKCKLCKRTHSASITTEPMAFDESKDSKGKGQKIIEFDCRGLEFTEFKADGKWEAKGTESGTKFSDISLEEGEWYDFDEKQGEEVSITEISWEIRRA